LTRSLASHWTMNRAENSACPVKPMMIQIKVSPLCMIGSG
jgi:hypothetical protein